MLFKFACYFPGARPLLLPINIESDELLMELKQRIETKLTSRGRDVSCEDLRLFKVNRSFTVTQPTKPHQTDISLNPETDRQSRALQWLHTQPADSHLLDARLESLFPNGTRLSGDLIDIIISNEEGMFCSVFLSLLLISC